MEKLLMLTRPSPEMTFAQASTSYLNLRRTASPGGRVRFIAERTIRDYEQYARALGRFFAEIPLREVHWGHIRNYQLWRASGFETDKNGARIEGGTVWDGPAGATRIRHEINYLIAVMRKAGAWTAEHDQTCERIQCGDSEVPRVPNPEEQAHWLATAAAGPPDDPHRWYLVHRYSILSIHATTGHQETRMIRLGDLNTYSWTLSVRAESAKNRHRIRSIPLTREAQWAAQWLIDRARELGAGQPHHYLFPFRVNRNTYDPLRPMTESGLKKLWEEVQKASGMQWFWINRCRHTGISRLAEAGVPLPVTMSMAGHISPEMHQWYTVISDQAKSEAVRLAFEKKPPQPAGGKHSLKIVENIP